jgi:hypothetical protein
LFALLRFFCFFFCLLLSIYWLTFFVCIDKVSVYCINIYFFFLRF